VSSTGALDVDSESAVIEAIRALAAGVGVALVGAAKEGAAASGITVATAIAASAILAATVGVGVDCAADGLCAADPEGAGRGSGVKTGRGGVDAAGLDVEDDDSETPGHTGGEAIVFLKAPNRADGANGD
jgi:hypothetical protein